MFGVICKNEETDRLEAWTIAGPTDGSTDIVHRRCDCDYQVPLAIDDQYGSGYVGISDCEKILFNPSTGEMTVPYVRGTAACVDINDNSDVSIQQPLLVQGISVETDEESGETTCTLGATVEITDICYNANCLICNDPDTGDPVYCKVVHIPFACIDRLDGITQGATICESDTNQSYNLTFTDETGTDVDLYVSCACPITYNPNNGFLNVSCIGVSSNSRAKFCSNSLELVTTNDVRDELSTIYQTSSSAGFCVSNDDGKVSYFHSSIDAFQFGSFEDDGDLGSLVRAEPTCLRFASDNIIFNKYSDDVTTNVKIENLPYTDSTSDANTFALVGLDVGTSQLKKLDGISYDPVTCVMCGNIISNLPPTLCCASSTQYGCIDIQDSCVQSCVACTSCCKGMDTYMNYNTFQLVAQTSAYCRYNIIGSWCSGCCVTILPTSILRLGGCTILAGTMAYTSSVFCDSNVSKGMLAYTTSDSNYTTQVGTHVCVSPSSSLVKPWNTYTCYTNSSSSGFITTIAENCECQTKRVQYVNCVCYAYKDSSVSACHMIECDGKLCYCSASTNNTFVPYALENDLPRVCNVEINSLAELKALENDKTYDIYFTTAFAMDDGTTIGQYSTANWYKTARTSTLVVCAHNGAGLCLYKACSNGSFYLGVKLPVCGTMYGTASTTAINVCGVTANF